ncbi:hypothetical protein Tco_0476637, partial [Tanacetum coccineum]
MEKWYCHYSSLLDDRYIKAKRFIIRKRMIKMRKKDVGLFQKKFTIPEGSKRRGERCDNKIRERSGIATQR